MGRRFGIVRALGLMAWGTVLGLLLIEGGLRAMPPYLPRDSRLALGIFRMTAAMDSTTEADPELRHRTKPNSDVAVEGHPEYRFHIRTYLNFPDAGFRGNVVPRPLVGVAVGDSFTFGAGVEAEEAWPEQLSRLAGRNFANLGVGAYGPQQYTSVLKRYGLALKPELVLYATYLGNDLRDAALFVKWQQEGGADKERFVERFVAESRRFLARYSHLYQVLHPSKVTEAIGDPKVLVMPEASPPASLRNIAWEALRDAILAARQLTQAAGATLVLVHLPPKAQAYHVRRPWAEGDTRQLLQLCEEYRIRCLDVTPRIQERTLAGEQLYFRLDGHWNAAGHRLAARTIYEYLVSQRLLDEGKR